MGGPIAAQAFPLTPGTGIVGSGTVAARVEFGLALAKWKILDCDSEDDVDGHANGAIDDNAKTFWHTRYRDGVDPMPHHVSVDLGETVTVRGFTYTSRQDPWKGGIILRARAGTFASNAPRNARDSEMKTASSGSPIAVITMPRKIAA